ncbi:hypothetical protein B0H14DRAFT_2597471 [Mycena olivaceomarginata]|nr:hypothetical protein B0H14DRAFT_2597471 [Mycena olivaceomarginata]
MTALQHVHTRIEFTWPGGGKNVPPRLRIRESNRDWRSLWAMAIASFCEPSSAIGVAMSEGNEKACTAMAACGTEWPAMDCWRAAICGCEGESTKVEEEGRRRPQSHVLVIAKKKFMYTDKSRSVKRKEK